MPKKICHITAVRPYYDDRILAKECTSLAHHGYEVHLIAANAPERAINRINIHTAPELSGTFRQQLKEARRLYLPLAAALGADLYHLHDPELLMLAGALKDAGGLVIYDVRDNIVEEIMGDSSVPAWRRHIQAWLIGNLEMRSARRADAVVAANQHLRDRFHHMGCLALDINDYPLREELNSMQPDYRMLGQSLIYIGEISGDRGLFKMLDLAHGLKAKLILVGEFLSSDEREQARQHAAWNKVEQLKSSDREAMNSALQQAPIGLALYEYQAKFAESEPIQFCHYMHAGIPFICSEFRLWKEFLAEHRCGFPVDAEDEKAVIELARGIIERPEQALEAGAGGRRAAAARFVWDSERTKLFALYEKLIKGREEEE